MFQSHVCPCQDNLSQSRKANTLNASKRLITESEPSA